MHSTTFVPKVCISDWRLLKWKLVEMAHHIRTFGHLKPVLSIALFHLHSAVWFASTVKWTGRISQSENAEILVPHDFTCYFFDFAGKDSEFRMQKATCTQKQNFLTSIPKLSYRDKIKLSFWLLRITIVRYTVPLPSL